MFVFIKQFPLSFALLIHLRVKFVNFLKSRLILNIFYCFRMFLNKHFTHAHILKSKKWCKLKSSAYCFHVKAYLSTDFQIYIIVPLSIRKMKEKVRREKCTKDKIIWFNPLYSKNISAQVLKTFFI